MVFFSFNWSHSISFVLVVLENIKTLPNFYNFIAFYFLLFQIDERKCSFELGDSTKRQELGSASAGDVQLDDQVSLRWVAYF